METRMNIQVLGGTLIVGISLAIGPPANQSLAQTEDANVSALQRMAANNTVATPKHRYWRFRGGKHPHFGSRRVRT
jgi:hypothetical protein